MLLTIYAACSPAPSGVSERASFPTPQGAEEHVHTVTVLTPRGRETLTFVDVDGQAFWGGDVLLGATADLLAAAWEGEVPPPAATVALTQQRWPDGVVPYYIDDTFDAAYQAGLDEAMADWSARAPVTFRPYDAVADTSWLRVTSASTGCFATVGHNEGQHTLNLGTGCESSARHELGHVLGLYHEQARADRDAYVSFHPENVVDADENGTDDELAQFTTWVSDGDYGWDIGTYDHGSVMHYDSGAFNGDLPCESTDTSGCTLTHLDGSYIDEHQRAALSASDVWSVWRQYAPLWQFSSAGTGPWVVAADTSFPSRGAVAADLDGARADEVVLLVDGVIGWYSFDTSAWSSVSAGFTPSTFRIGDFDGDGRSDILADNGARWQYRSGGVGRWVRLSAARGSLADTLVGDVDGDGIDDLVRAGTGSRWRYAAGGNGAWTSWGNGMPAIADARVGDVDGDGLADVVTPGDGNLRLFRGSTRAWEDLDLAGRADDLLLADLSGDGVDDVVVVEDGQLDGLDLVSGAPLVGLVSDGVEQFSGGEIVAGDFDDDGVDDLLTAATPYSLEEDATLWIGPDSALGIGGALDVLELFGGGELVLWRGTYDLDERRCLPSNVTIRGVSTGAVTVRGASDEGVLCAWEATGVALEGLTLDDASGGAGTGLWLWDADATLTDVAFVGGADSWGVYARGGSLTVRGATFTGMERGLVVSEAEVELEAVVVDGPAEIGLDLSETTGAVYSTTVVGGEVGVYVNDDTPTFAHLTLVDQSTAGIEAEIERNAGFSVNLVATNVAFDGAAPPVVYTDYWGSIALSSCWYREGSWPTLPSWQSRSITCSSAADLGLDGEGRLEAGSVLIDAGVTSGAAVDVDGESRSTDGDGDGVAAPDVGADELP